MVVLCFVLFFNAHLPQTNGKKKSKGNLTLMVGQALQPGSAGEEISVNTTELVTGIVLSLPGGSCNENTNGHQLLLLFVQLLCLDWVIFSAVICKKVFFIYSSMLLLMNDVQIFIEVCFGKQPTVLPELEQKGLRVIHSNMKCHLQIKRLTGSLLHC